MKNILWMYSSILMLGIITRQPVTVKQGIAGKVYARHGNYMPSPGRKTDEGKPVSTTILVYQLTTRQQALGNGSYFDHIQTKLVAKTQSNTQGSYAVELPPGSYSVFVAEGDKLYANSFDGNGHINPVEVKQDSVAQKDITISSKAVY